MIQARPVPDRRRSPAQGRNPSLRRCLRQRSSTGMVSGHNGVRLLPHVLPRGITNRVSTCFPIRFVVMCFHCASPMSELPSPALSASMIVAFNPRSAASITARSSCGSKSMRSRGGPLAFSRLLSISHKPGMVIQPSLSRRLNAALTKANRVGPGRLSLPAIGSMMAVVAPSEKVGFIDSVNRYIAALRVLDERMECSYGVVDRTWAFFMRMQPLAIGVTDIANRSDHDSRLRQGVRRWLVLRFGGEVSPGLLDGASDRRDPTVIDAAELAIARLVDQARFEKEAVSSKGGLFVGPEVVHFALEELAELPGNGVVSELDSPFGSRHRPYPPIPSERIREGNRQGRNLIAGI